MVSARIDVVAFFIKPPFPFRNRALSVILWYLRFPSVRSGGLAACRPFQCRADGHHGRIGAVRSFGHVPVWLRALLKISRDAPAGRKGGALPSGVGKIPGTACRDAGGRLHRNGEADIGKRRRPILCMKEAVPPSCRTALASLRSAFSSHPRHADDLRRASAPGAGHRMWRLVLLQTRVLVPESFCVVPAPGDAIDCPLIVGESHEISACGMGHFTTMAKQRPFADIIATVLSQLGTGRLLKGLSDGRESSMGGNEAGMVIFHPFAMTIRLRPIFFAA